jgi:hypothetical protein
MSNNLTSNISLFQPTGFKVIIDRKNYGNLEFFVQSVSHPGATNPAIETSYKRISSVPQPGGQMEYGELTMDVMLDEDMNSYTEMYNWMLRLVNIEQVVSRRVSDQPTYADIKVIALTGHNNPNKTFTYVDCIPVAIGDIRFEAQNQSVEFVTFPASFRFSYFDIE